MGWKEAKRNGQSKQLSKRSNPGAVWEGLTNSTSARRVINQLNTPAN